MTRQERRNEKRFARREADRASRGGRGRTRWFSAAVQVKRDATLGRRVAREMTLAALLTACERCGRLLHFKEVDVHHVDGDPNRNVPGNLVCLCRPCHAEADKLMRAARPGPYPDPRRFEVTVRTARLRQW